MVEETSSFWLGLFDNPPLIVVDGCVNRSRGDVVRFLVECEGITLARCPG
jgi:hypothetical protein